MPAAQLLTEWKISIMPEDNSESRVTVGRSYQIRKPLDKALDHLKIDLERDKTDLVNEAIEAYVTSVSLRVVGQVCAGEGTLAEENVESWVSLPAWLANGADYLLRVKGDSMEPTLSPGDLVGVKQGAATHPGDMVVAILVGDEEEPESSEPEGVIKRRARRERTDYLDSDNPIYQPLPLHGCQVVGKVVSVSRALR